MAHDNYEQLELLVRALDHPRTDIYIHIDNRSKMFCWDRIKTVPVHSKINLYREFDIYWADFSQTRCELFLIEKALSNGKYDYYHLISNADFPTMPQGEILKFFDGHYGKEFVSFRFPHNAWPFNDKPYTTEIKYYHFFSKHYRNKNKIIRRLAYWAEYSLVAVQFLLRVDRIKGQFVAAKGSQWFSITDDFARYIISRKNWIEKQFSRTRSADEVFPAVLVYNNPRFKDALYTKEYDCSCEANQRYIDWKRGFPYTFKIDDYDEIISSGLPFVRKTDMRIDGGLVLKLFEHCTKTESK